MSKFKKVKVEGRQGIDIKRFYFPLVVEHDCPTCKEKVSVDFESQYLYYPTLNTTETVVGYCSSCDNSYEFDIVLQISLKVSKEARDSNE